MMKYLFIAFLAIVTGMILFFAYVYSPRGMVLVAQSEVAIYATEEEAIKRPLPSAISVLPAGQSVPVMRCSYGKDYRIVRVHLPDGRDGFVVDGKYVLMRDGESVNC